MYCKKCGTLNEDSATFCRQCGDRLRAAQADAEQQGAPLKKQAEKKKLLIGSAIGGALLVCVAAILFITAGSRPLPGGNGEKGQEAGKTQEVKGDISGETHTEDTDAVPAPPRGTYISVIENGGLDIRRVQLGDTSMGPEGTYTIFVYMCGSDLESDAGLATEDLREMVNASTNDNVRFIIQTGGAESWQNDVVNAGELGRYEIYGGEIYTLDPQPAASMGDADTLSAFLEWGVEYAPAAKMGLVFWDHGGGSIVGVCLDRVSRDILTLAEIDSALTKVSEKMTDKFEFIGFDACLMASVECAYIYSA